MQTHSVKNFLGVLTLAFAGLFPCHGQSVALTLSTVTGTPGSAVTLGLGMTGGSDLPSSIQWTLNYSPSDFTAASLVAGTAVTNAGKTLSCSSATGSTTCVVWGGAASISSGQIANLSLTLSPSTKSASSPLQIVNSTAADANGMALTTTAAGGTVVIQQPPGLNGLSCNATTLMPPATTSCTVQLTAPALSGGATINLSASSGAVSVPATVRVAAGASSASFTVASQTVTTSTQVTVTATYSGISEAFGLTVVPPAIVPGPKGLSVSPNPITGGQTAVGTLTLSAVAAGGATVALSSSNAAVVAVPTSVTVAAGSSTATFTVSTSQVSTPVCAIIYAQASGEVAKANIIVRPATTTGAAACFQGFDTTTQGNWESAYGNYAYSIAGNVSSGSGAIVPLARALILTSNTTDIRALEKPASSGRIAAYWSTTTPSMVIGIGLPDKNVHPLAVYGLDWNSQNIVEIVTVVDASSGAVIDRRLLSGFSNGIYLMWNIAGNVQLWFTRIAGPSTVASGVFISR